MLDSGPNPHFCQYPLKKKIIPRWPGQVSQSVADRKGSTEDTPRLKLYRSRIVGRFARLEVGLKITGNIFWQEEFRIPK